MRSTLHAIACRLAHATAPPTGWYPPPGLSPRWHPGPPLVLPVRLRVRLVSMTVPVLIAPANELRLDGQRVESCSDLDARCIWIDGDVSRARRLEALLCEVWNGWRLIVGRPDVGEAESSLFAAAAEPIFEDLVAQGGVAALMAMEPDLATWEGRHHA